MPLVDIGSYPPVMGEFDNHWASVNTELGGAPASDLKLASGFTRADFGTLRASIVGSLTGAEGLENTRQIAVETRNQSKAALRERLFQLRGMFRGLLSKTKYAAAVPLLPDLSMAESKFLSPFDDAADLWGRVNADVTLAGFTPPLTIGSYTQAMFVTDLAAVRVAFAAVSSAENAQTIDIRERDGFLTDARERMVQYRVLVPAMLGQNHPLALSLPDLYPAPGSTPDASTLSGAWNAATTQADLSWTASSAATLDEYEVRMSPGSTYDAATSSVIGHVPAGTTSFSTAEGLAASAAVASFKVFVKLTTGNEAGSNTITITRP